MEPLSWFDRLDERERKEVQLAQLYANNFAHGTAGHNRLILIATLSKMLDEYSGIEDFEQTPEMELGA